ncbi:hypothetical protein Snoj_28300 [Streptomyces nojiriensis]|uniref:Uncharacterized protein n=1 Tax=Streptomyces nojiriensis TaxID=66374 RepID=A0ABQ3SLR4_9ACTN|nr:hypothetical protein Snoj_28300 [Streptomyces nojiriensis]
MSTATRTTRPAPGFYVQASGGMGSLYTPVLSLTAGDTKRPGLLAYINGLRFIETSPSTPPPPWPPPSSCAPGPLGGPPRHSRRAPLGRLPRRPLPGEGARRAADDHLCAAENPADDSRIPLDDG